MSTRTLGPTACAQPHRSQHTEAGQRLGCDADCGVHCELIGDPQVPADLTLMTAGLGAGKCPDCASSKRAGSSGVSVTQLQTRPLTFSVSRHR